MYIHEINKDTTIGMKEEKIEAFYHNHVIH